MKKKYLIFGFVLLTQFCAVAAEQAAPAASQASTKPFVDCSKVELTHDKFLEKLHTIAMHGDLTDVPFIEKTLQTRLTLHVSKKHGNEANHDGRLYRANSLLGAPIFITLGVGFNSSEHTWNDELKDRKVGGLQLVSWNGEPIVFHDCGYLSKDKLEKAFGGWFVHVPVIGSGLTEAASQRLNSGREGSAMGIGYSFRISDGAVNGVSIDMNQRP